MGLLMGLREGPFCLRPMNSQGIWWKVRYQMGVHGQPAFGGLFSFESNSNLPAWFKAWKADTPWIVTANAPPLVCQPFGLGTAKERF